MPPRLTVARRCWSSAATPSFDAGSLLDELRRCGLLYQVSAVTRHSRLGRALCDAQPDSNSLPGVYMGVDPSAPSLHVGNLVQLCALLRFRRRGFPTIALVGGATGLIGDPSGRATERDPVNDREAIQRNVDAISADVKRVLSHGDGPEPQLVNNADWTVSLSALDFLRDVGKHFSVSSMLARESVRARLDGAGLSYCEFSYQLLQAHDFLVLQRSHDVGVQIGGSDQWGNIVAGVDLIRRRAALHASDASQSEAAALTVPLLVDANGNKLGKSAGNAPVWLSATLTAPFDFYQYFMQRNDADAAAMLPLLTLLDADTVHDTLTKHDVDRAQRIAQRTLASAVTEIVHGSAVTRAVQQASDIM